MHTRLKKYEGAFREMKQEQETLLQKPEDSKESTMEILAILKKLNAYEELQRTVQFVPLEIMEAARQMKRINTPKSVRTIGKGA